MDWLITGPLLFRGELSGPPAPGIYPAGDALGFVDPFTGTGMLSAVWSGMLAGRCAAAGVPVSRYLGICRSGLVTQYRAAAAFRRAAAWSGAGFLARLVPGNLLYRLTRPRIA
jgi:flavin-dependent dehydrogenase